ncbi:hypothetical protein MTP99_007761 [Tenebrio molitor]|nr:hypothetical protein MTP99_007761 [Tenebrio molitor]
MLAEGVIEPSDSPWSSPIVLAKKKFSFKSWFRRPGRTPFILVSQRSLVLKVPFGSKKKFLVSSFVSKKSLSFDSLVWDIEDIFSLKFRRFCKKEWMFSPS